MRQKIGQIAPDKFEAYEACILAERIPQTRVPSLLGASPDFAAWYRKRHSLAPDAGEGDVLLWNTGGWIHPRGKNA